MDGIVGGTKLARHEKYNENLASGQRFEDYASGKLYDAGMVVVPYRSAAFQHRYGESRARVEIKYDDQRCETENLFIEISEKTHADDEKWKPAGIYGKGSFLCVGDYHKLWLFGFRTLQRAHQSERYRVVVNKSKTGQGFLLPVEVADEIAEWVDPPREHMDLPSK